MKKLNRTRKIAIVAGTLGLVTAAGTGVAVATGGDDDASDRPITGDALERAERAALAETGGGTVTETEIDDEDSKYEVEVTLEDGSQVDVQLDEQFEVVGTEGDTEDDTEDHTGGGE